MGSAGSSILSSSTTRESGPGAFQLCIPRIARLGYSSVGADPSITASPVLGAAGRCCASSMGAGFSLGIFQVAVVVVVVFTLKAIPISTQYFLTSILVQLTRTPSVVTG